MLHQWACPGAVWVSRDSMQTESYTQKGAYALVSTESQQMSMPLGESARRPVAARAELLPCVGWM